MSSSKKDIKPAFTVAQYSRVRELVMRGMTSGKKPIESRIIDELDRAFNKACDR